MKKRYLLFLFYFAMLLYPVFTGCRTMQSGDNDQGYIELAEGKYNGEIVYLKNDKKTHVICLHRKKTSAKQPHPAVSFFVYSIPRKQIIWEEKLVNGELEWKTDSEIEVKITPEAITGDEQPGEKDYIYNINSEKKIFKNKN